MKRDAPPARRAGAAARGLARALLGLAPAIRRGLAALVVGAVAGGAAVAEPLSFGVVPQRTATLTAQYWNPILNYIGARSGIALELRLARSGPEHAAMIGSGSLDLAYTNHHLSPANAAAGYRAFARPTGAPIRSEIVVLEQSTLRSLDALHGKEVGFPSRAAVFGYLLPMDTLVRAGIKVTPVFGGTQEGIMGQLRAGGIAAASVNSQVMRDFAEREKFAYRVLWRSESFHNIPLVARPGLPRTTVTAVLDAFLSMAADPEGAKILAAGAELLKLDPPFGFEAAKDSEYDNARSFLRSSVLTTD
jgi:phosphonate transport system substrate-binding protein